MPRACPMSTMKKRGSMAREGAAFICIFLDLTEYEIFVPQQQINAEHNGILRETAITPAQWKGKVAAWEWFICGGAKVSYGADNGVCGLRAKKTSCK